MNLFVDLLKALAGLLWPVLGFTIVFMFKDQIRDSLRRLKKGKILGQEVELEASLKELNATAVAAAQEVGFMPLSDLEEDVIEISEPEDEEEILKLAAASPKTALVALSAIVEREARDVLATSGHLKGRNRVPLHEAIHEISERLPQHIPGSLKQFRDVRNKIVHGQVATDDDVLRAIDSGITILRALRAIPREINVVYHPGVVLYSDPKGLSELPNVKYYLGNNEPGRSAKESTNFPDHKELFFQRPASVLGMVT